MVQLGYRPQVWHYRCEQTQEELRTLWDGDQITDVRHYRNGALVSRRHWVHNGWELLVQQRQNTDGRWETDFVTSSQNGEPQAVFNPQGELRWRAPKSTLWGQRQSHLEENIDPSLGFAGQYRDTESGLCYNRFRYYDPAGGCYVSPDPASILGVRITTGMCRIRIRGLIRLGWLVVI
ncbi:hypothetical protein BV918_16285 [Pectobacterium odoriferum]|nr:hypothetical protein BV918_16285 [Pectobacterium odoriferum]POE32871.1 hypothetical protein BV922_15810 [Pectobacterium odoriferum]